MNGGSIACIFSVSTNTDITILCVAYLSCLYIILRHFLINKLISAPQRPVRIYYLCKTGIPWTLNCFLNRAHDKQQLAPKFLLKTGCCQTLTLIASRSPKLQHTQQYLHYFVTYIAAIWASIIVIMNDLTPAIVWCPVAEVLKVAILWKSFGYNGFIKSLLFIQILWYPSRVKGQNLA